MIEIAHPCARFQTVAWNWLQSGEIARTKHLLSPLEELAGFNYGFVYLMRVDARSVKIGHSLHPMRRLRELAAQYSDQLRLIACFVGEPSIERLVHRRFKNLRVCNEIFYAHPLIESYFAHARQEMRLKLRALHICAASCPQLRRQLDLTMLATWLARS